MSAPIRATVPMWADLERVRNSWLRNPPMRSMAGALASIPLLLTAACTTYSGRPDNAAQPEPLRTSFEERKDVVYTPPGHSQAVKADFYIPAGEGVHPGVIVVHGGGWNGRDRSDMDSISRSLARRGFVVANIDYRLVPGFRHPAQVDDVRTALTYLRAHAGELKLDPQRVGGWGYSAGAHLLAMAAMERSGATPLFRAVVAGGMPADFQRYPTSPVITDLIGKTMSEEPAAWVRASPITHVSSDDPPMFLFQGTWDRIVEPEESVEMQRRLQAAGVPAELVRVHGLGHIATFLLGGAARDHGVDFLDRYLR
ncbi:MAG: alpha/beta hydrolase fold domain-containing protein [Panacagrimonas sp.]